MALWSIHPEQMKVLEFMPLQNLSKSMLKMPNWLNTLVVKSIMFCQFKIGKAIFSFNASTLEGNHFFISQTFTKFSFLWWGKLSWTENIINLWVIDSHIVNLALDLAKKSNLNRVNRFVSVILKISAMIGLSQKCCLTGVCPISFHPTEV